MRNLFMPVLVAAAVAGGVGWCAAPRGMSPEEAAELARAQGDSAVLSYRKSVAVVIGQLTDSVAYYRARPQAGARLVVRRDTVRQVDTVEVAAGPPGDTVDIRLAPITQDGMRLEETIDVAPRPTFLARRATLVFNPDTILVAILKLPNGLERFTAAGTRAGLAVTVADAAGTPPGRGAGLALQLGTGAGCGVAGWAAGNLERRQLAGVLGALVCVVGQVAQARRGR